MHRGTHFFLYNFKKNEHLTHEIQTIQNTLKKNKNKTRSDKEKNKYVNQTNTCQDKLRVVVKYCSKTRIVSWLLPD